MLLIEDNFLKIFNSCEMEYPAGWLWTGSRDCPLVKECTPWVIRNYLHSKVSSCNLVTNYTVWVGYLNNYVSRGHGNSHVYLLAKNPAWPCNEPLCQPLTALSVCLSVSNCRSWPLYLSSILYLLTDKLTLSKSYPNRIAYIDYYVMGVAY